MGKLPNGRTDELANGGTKTHQSEVELRFLILLEVGAKKVDGKSEH
jgi:hypothetical protein